MSVDGQSFETLHIRLPRGLANKLRHLAIDKNTKIQYIGAEAIVKWARENGVEIEDATKPENAGDAAHTDSQG